MIGMTEDRVEEDMDRTLVTFLARAIGVGMFVTAATLAYAAVMSGVRGEPVLAVVIALIAAGVGMGGHMIGFARRRPDDPRRF